MPKPHSDGLEGTLVTDRSDNMHRKKKYQAHLKGAPSFPQKLEEQHSHFSGSPGPGRCGGLTLLAVPLGVHHHHCSEHHAAG